MRALRVVGINEDGSVVLEDSGRRERFTVPADEQLRAAARGDLTRLGQIATELESQLRPREIQARIRAGASVEQVAAAAGVPPQKIERFAYPVLLERSRTIEVAQRAHPIRPDGPDARTLVDVIANTFGLRGLEYTEAEWDSWKGEDGKWVVALSWRAGRSDNRAHWTFHPGAHGGTVTALDEHAGDLVEGLSARPLRTVGPVIDMARPEEGAPAEPPEELRAAASDIAVRSAAGMRVDAARDRQPAARVQTEQRPPAPPAQRTADPRTADPRTADPRAVEQRLADPRTAEQRAAEQRAADQRALEQRAAPQRTAEPRPAEAETTAHPMDNPATAETPGRPAEPVTPATEPATEPAAESLTPTAAAGEPAPTGNRRTKKGKPVMPSWDEVLLGVRGQR